MSTSFVLLFVTMFAEESRVPADRLFSHSIQRQKDFCINFTEHIDPSAETRLELVSAEFQGTPLRLFVYSSDDIVSRTISLHGRWDVIAATKFYTTIRHYMQQRGITDPRSLSILDIGARVGWYALGLGAAGFRVVAFEPMKHNVYMIRKSYCINPNIALTLIGRGLGREAARCRLYSKDNVGSPEMYCGEAAPGKEHVQAETVDVYRLDDFADVLQDLVAIKLDIAGFEHNVMKGGRKVLLERHVPFILSAFSVNMTLDKGGDPGEYLQEYERAGYRLSVTKFGESVLPAGEIMRRTANGAVVSLYMVHNSTVLQ